MAGIELETLKDDKAAYMERILQHEESLNEHQGIVQELQVRILHAKGALAHVNTNIEAVVGQMKEEERIRREAEEEVVAQKEEPDG